jgi:hypothetical protein
VRRAVLASSVTAVLAGLALPSFAQPSVPVGVQYDTKGRVYVGVTVNGNPGVGADVENGKACVGVSLQLPFCQQVPPITR